MSDVDDFTPAWWLPGPHLQAVGARLLRPRGRVRCERERLELPDDDPFLPSSAIPRAEVQTNPHLDAIFPEHGGHVGFVSGPPWAPVFWAEQTAAAFLASHLL